MTEIADTFYYVDPKLPEEGFVSQNFGGQCKSPPFVISGLLGRIMDGLTKLPEGVNLDVPKSLADRTTLQEEHSQHRYRIGMGLEHAAPSLRRGAVEVSLELARDYASVAAQLVAVETRVDPEFQDHESAAMRRLLEVFGIPPVESNANTV